MTSYEIASHASSLAMTAWDAAVAADRAAYDRASLAAKAVDAARQALAAAIAEHDRATAASNRSFIARSAAFTAWDHASNARTELVSAFAS